MEKIGRWIDYDKGYATMDKSYMNSVWWVFSELYKKGKIYEGTKIMPFSVTCGTPLSNFETQQNYKEINDDSLFLKFNLKFNAKNHITINNIIYNNIKIIVWTTTPWTLVSNYLLCINKNFTYNLINCNNEYLIVNKKLTELVMNNKEYIIITELTGDTLINIEYEPIFTYNKLHTDYKIIHGDFVSEENGTGVVHCSPSFGEEDYNVCITNNIITKQTKLFIPLTDNGYVTKEIPEIQGLFYKNFNDKTKEDLNTWVVKKLKEKDLFFEKKTILHNYPFCWRSDTPLIYRATSSHFVKVDNIREELVELNKQINWYPKFVGEKRFASWLANARDWGISRNRYWGTPIPIWKSEDGDEICISSSYELEEKLNLPKNSITDLHCDSVDKLIITYNGKEYKRVSTILDCWFESGAMPYASLNNIGIVEVLRKSTTGIEYDSNNQPFIKTNDNIIHKILPSDFIAEGLDQTRGWFYTLLVLSTLLFKIIPFKNVIVNGIILAENGEKMSKRLKNYPDPYDIVKKYSSDCLRLYLLGSQASEAEPLKFSEKGANTIMKDVIIKLKKGTIAFLKEQIMTFYNKNNKIIQPLYDLNETKINKCCNLNNFTNCTNPINIWILNKYNEHRNKYFENMDDYNLKKSIQIILTFIEELNNGFIKIGKFIMKGNEGNDRCIESLNTLYLILRFMSNDFKALMPFTCEMLNLELNKIYDGQLVIINDNINDNINENKIKKQNNKSIHLYLYDTFINLNPEQIELAFSFEIIYNIILEIYKIRSKNNICVKKPLKKIKLLFDDNLKQHVKNEYYNYIFDECNIIDIEEINNQDVIINKKIKPIKALLLKKHGKDFLLSYDELTNKNDNELEQIIKNKTYNNFEITQNEFNIDYDIEFKKEITSKITSEITSEITPEITPEIENNIFSEIKINNNSIIIIADIVFNQELEKLYYFRTVATTIQKLRKETMLHPWNKIKIYWFGECKYIFDVQAYEYINKTIKMEFTEYNDNADIYFSKYCENIGLNIYIETFF